MNSDREAELRKKLSEKKDSTKDLLKNIQFWFIAICAVLIISFMLPIIAQKPKGENSIDSIHLVNILKWIVLSVAILTTVTVVYIRKKKQKSHFSDED